MSNELTENENVQFREEKKEVPWNVSPNFNSVNGRFDVVIESVLIPSEGVKLQEDEKDQHTLYSVEVRLIGGLRWFIDKRFTEFREFNEKLRKTHPEMKNIPFPKRHLFRSKQGAVIEQRRVELEMYCAALLNFEPFPKTCVFQFLEVYTHMESFERKKLRKQKMGILDAMKKRLDEKLVEDVAQAFQRLGPSTTRNQAEEEMGCRLSKISFRHDVFAVFPDMPTTFATRFVKACTERNKNDIHVDEFMAAVAVMMKGSIDEKLGFLFQMCDHDHAGKVPNSGLNNVMLAIHGRSFVDQLAYRGLLNDVFQGGALRFSYDEFIKKCIENPPFAAMATEWMVMFIKILLEPPNEELMALQEEHNPEAQQQLLAVETQFSIHEIQILQDNLADVRNTMEDLKASEMGSDVDAGDLADLFGLDLKLERVHRLFASFGKRANGTDIDIFSFANALDIACRGSPHAKAVFAFNLYDSSHTKTLYRDELFNMFQYDLTLDKTTNTNKIIFEYFDKENNLKIQPDAVLTGNQVGEYVDFVMSTYGSGSPLVLSVEQFEKWSRKVEFQLALLDVLKIATFSKLGLAPKNRAEEVSITKLCEQEYPESNLQDGLVEGETWYLVVQSWYDQWKKYISQSNAERPHNINNTSLQYSKEGSPPILNKNITLGKDFAIVNDTLWHMLKEWYGGGPEIKRTVILLFNGDLTLDLWGMEKVEDEVLIRESMEKDPILMRHMSSSSSFSMPRLRPGNSLGLANVGNTCYMNSALQCLCNTRLLSEYFLNGTYIDDINKTSTLGLKGELAEEYGKLLGDIWNKLSYGKMLSPRCFKKTIGKFNEAFRGNDQQDSQELLAFLLSGLSEDLNRIKEVPYTEQPDSDGRYDGDLADEWWRNHLRREVSIIVALFTGQYKSLLTCDQCGFKSARFEPFTCLQVPLPEPTHFNVTIKVIFDNGQLEPKSISMSLATAATIADMKAEIVDISKRDFGLTLAIELLMVVEVVGSFIVNLKTDTRRIAQLRSLDRLYVYELNPVDNLAPVIEVPSYTIGGLIQVKNISEGIPGRPGVIVDVQENNKFAIEYQSGDISYDIERSRITVRDDRMLHVMVISRKLNYNPHFLKNPFRPLPCQGYPLLLRICPERMTGIELYNIVYAKVKRFISDSSVHEPVACEVSDSLDGSYIDQLFKSNYGCGFSLRRVDAKGVSDSRKQWLTRSYGKLILFDESRLDLLEDEVVSIDWDLRLVQEKLVDLDDFGRIASHPATGAVHGSDKGPVPLSYSLNSFTSQEKISEGYCSCCQMHHQDKMTKKLNIWRLPPILVIHLKRFQYTPTYRRKLTSMVKFPLYDLDLKPYVASASDVESCQPYPTKDNKTVVDSNIPDTNVPETPSIDTNTATPKVTRMHRGYTNTTLEGSRCNDTSYNLYGVVNHMGGIGAGHYTAYCKNSADGNWYYYDDERVRLIEESKVVTSNAYLLFYVRTDMEGIPIQEVYPPNTNIDITEADIELMVQEGDSRRCNVM